jgi:small subunit ribosomal protein S11
MKLAIVHIFSTYNNTKMLATDVTGAETLAKSSGGIVTKSQHKQGSPYVAMKMAEQIASTLKTKGYDNIIVKVRAVGGIKAKNPGQGADAAITSLTRSGMNIVEIENVTPLPHDGCRPKKKYLSKKKQ